MDAGALWSLFHIHLFLRDWAKIQIGEVYRKSPQYIADLFAKYRSKDLTERVVSIVPLNVQHKVRHKKSIFEMVLNLLRSDQKMCSKHQGLSKCNYSLSSIADKELKKTERLRKVLWKQQKKQLLRAPRYSDGFVSLFGKPFRYIDTHSLVYTVDHIFNRGVYAFDSDSKNPLIIDAGANVGVSLLYFKREVSGL